MHKFNNNNKIKILNGSDVKNNIFSQYIIIFLLEKGVVLFCATGSAVKPLFRIKNKKNFFI